LWKAEVENWFGKDIYRKISSIKTKGKFMFNKIRMFFSSLFQCNKNGGHPMIDAGEFRRTMKKYEGMKL